MVIFSKAHTRLFEAINLQPMTSEVLLAKCRV